MSIELLTLLTSSLSSVVVTVLLGWAVRIDRRTTRNHETLHDTENGEGLKTRVKEHRETLLSEGLIKTFRSDGGKEKPDL